MKQTYSEKLRDPRWQKKRLEVLEACDWMCVGCHAVDRPLNVHHRWYISGRAPWEYPDIALTTLCDECHKGHPEEDQPKVEEWEMLLSVLFDQKEHLWDGLSIAGEVMLRDPALAKQDLRDSIEMMLSCDELLMKSFGLAMLRRQRWAQKTAQKGES